MAYARNIVDELVTRGRATHSAEPDILGVIAQSNARKCVVCTVALNEARNNQHLIYLNGNIVRAPPLAEKPSVGMEHTPIHDVQDSP